MALLLNGAVREEERVIARPGGLRILVVVDPTEAGPSLADALRPAGHEVILVPDGPTAVAAAPVDQPDVVVLDGLGSEARQTVARALHAQSAWRRPFLIALADAADEEAVRRAEEAGLDLLLPRPIDVGRLLWVLRRFQSIVADVQSFDPMI